MVLIIARSNFQALGFKLKVKKKRQNIQKLAFKYGKFLYVPVPCVNPILVHVIPVQFEFNEYT